MFYPISHYTADDYEDVWALHQETVRSNGGFVKNLAFHTDIHDIPHVYKAFFVMHDGDRVVGMVGLKEIDPTTLEIKRLQVAAPYQKQGHAKRLMEHAENYARGAGISTLCLDVSKPQEKARQLYLFMGFQVTHVETRTYGPDNEEFLMTFMEKKLK